MSLEAHQGTERLPAVEQVDNLENPETTAPLTSPILSLEDNNLLRSQNQIDLNDGFEIAMDSPIEMASAARITNEVVSEGRVVRREMSSGPDMVVAYDDAGNQHIFPDRPQTLPVDLEAGIPEWRKQQLDRRAQEIIKDSVGTPNTEELGGEIAMGLSLPRVTEVSFNDMADIMDTVANAEDLTEQEKARVYSDIVREFRRNPDYEITTEGAQEEVVDDWQEDDTGHAILPLNDRYHGDRLINADSIDSESREEAMRIINSREIEGEEADTLRWDRQIQWNIAQSIFGPNMGDVVSSQRQVLAMVEYLNDGFAGYARAWRQHFVESN